ncbi:transketolase [candidate division KSB1 bacterium]|nr:transketolase [candidate division KSB1 bacterium]
MQVSKADPDFVTKCVNTIRFLCVDSVQKANSGHPGMPMGMASVAFELWTKFMQFNPSNPDWSNRDRFILSAGHGSILLYSMLHLTGYDLSLDELKNFRQWGSKTPGHPEYGCAPGIETTTGPLGQGFANGVGMAIAQKMTANKFNRPDFKLIDHFIYAIAGDGDLMEGVASEAASLAGHLQLGNLIYFYDDNKITIEGKTVLAFSEDVAGRFKAYGWQILKIDGNDHAAICDAVEKARAETQKPSLIITRTHIAYGSPNKQDTADAHGAPLGAEEVKLTKQALNWQQSPDFFIPPDVKDFFNTAVAEKKKAYTDWQQRFTKWQAAHPDLAEEWRKMQNHQLPDDLEKQLMDSIGDAPNATRAFSGIILQKAAEIVPNLVGGSADLAPSNKSNIKAAASFSAGNNGGRNLHFGVREHAMGSILNGMSLYGGWIPYGATFLVFADYARPAIRLAALMEKQVIYIFTHDSFFVGEDGPTHQPVEHVSSLQIIPNMIVMRPADGLETAAAWAYALRRTEGPTALCLTRQTLPVLHVKENFDARQIHKGAYIVDDTPDPDLVIVASGSEVGPAIEAKKLLEQKGRSVRVVSLPAAQLFERQSPTYRRSIIPDDRAKVVAIEAGVPDRLYRIVGKEGMVLGLDHFGASAPAKVLAEKFGFTGKQLAASISSWLDA